MPANTFQHVEGDSFETGKALVQQPYTSAVGFTGSFSGGRALYDYAAARPKPIPVFSAALTSAQVISAGSAYSWPSGLRCK